jgi:hypothetical protein
MPASYLLDPERRVVFSRAWGVLPDAELAAAADADQFRIVRAIEPALEWIGLDPATRWPSQAPDATFDVP